MDFDGSLASNSFDHSTNPDSVEAIIDACRLSCDWDGVLSGIKKYAHIFEVGAATSSYQHADIDAVRAHYWVCMGEAQYELKGDYNNAIECAKRAMAIDQSCVEARVIVARVFLDNCGSVLRMQRSPRKEVVNTASDVPENLDAHSILSELLKVLFCFLLSFLLT